MVSSLRRFGKDMTLEEWERCEVISRMDTVINELKPWLCMHSRSRPVWAAAQRLKELLYKHYSDVIDLRNKHRKEYHETIQS